MKNNNSIQVWTTFFGEFSFLGEVFLKDTQSQKQIVKLKIILCNVSQRSAIACSAMRSGCKHCRGGSTVSLSPPAILRSSLALSWMVWWWYSWRLRREDKLSMLLRQDTPQVNRVKISIIRYNTFPSWLSTLRHFSIMLC